jgi:hypothetical protein
MNELALFAGAGGGILGGGGLDGELSAQLNVMPTQAKFWRNDKTMEFSSLSQFGLTSQLLTESRGQELLMSYLGAFHAKTSAQQVKAQVSKVQEVECGKRWQELLARYDPLTHLWKTAQCSLLEDLELSLQTWPRWGSMRNGACYLQPMLAHSIKENVYGCWLPTPTSSMWRGAAKQRYMGSKKYRASFTQEWIRVSPDCDQYLNPDYAESLMGFPIKWTDLEPLVMHKSHSAQQQPLPYLEKD